MAPWHGPNDSKHQGSQLQRHQSWDQWMPIVHALPCFPARGGSQHERIEIVLEALQSHHWLDECGQHMAKILTDVSDLQHVSPPTHYTAQTTTTVSANLCWLTHVHNKTSRPNMSLQLVSTDKHLYCWWKHSAPVDTVNCPWVAVRGARIYLNRYGGYQQVQDFVHQEYANKIPVYCLWILSLHLLIPTLGLLP